MAAKRLRCRALRVRGYLPGGFGAPHDGVGAIRRPFPRECRPGRYTLAKRVNGAPTTERATSGVVSLDMGDLGATSERRPRLRGFYCR